MDIPQKTKNRVPYDTQIPLLAIYPDKTIIWKDTCTLMFIAALLTVTKTWKLPKCPSTDRCTKKMWYIYTVEFYSTTEKKNGIMSFAATWMHLEIIISQSGKDRYYMISRIYGIKNNIQMNLQNRNRLTDIDSDQQRICVKWHK